ncbi:unnamed protein product [Dicrocoelium dendriticum]|nr:unnamed protein product [Dicrocoelium dendriticum]
MRVRVCVVRCLGCRRGNRGVTHELGRRRTWEGRLVGDGNVRGFRYWSRHDVSRLPAVNTHSILITISIQHEVLLFPSNNLQGTDVRRCQRFTDGIDTPEKEGASAHIGVYPLNPRIDSRWRWTN